jgi:hypothetical protein
MSQIFQIDRNRVDRQRFAARRLRAAERFGDIG